MAEVLIIDGQQYKRRNPWGAWGLSLITLGIYGLVWYYRINDEARRFLRDETIKPWVALLAVFPGGLLVIPPFVSIYRTGERIQRMQSARVEQQVTPIVGLVAALFLSLHIVYYQSELNRVWDASRATNRSTDSDLSLGTPGTPLLPPPPPPPPPAAG